MHIRVLRAATMPEAMARLKEELGDNAVLLSSRQADGGVELVAGLELPEAARAAAAPQPAMTPASPEGAALRFHNLPPALTDRLASGPLEATLQTVLRFAPLPDGVMRPLLLTGPPGAGKTLTCTKLAARRVLSGGSPPMLIAADGERAAAAEQLAVFTRLLGASLEDGTTPDAARAALARREPGMPALIDTPGIDPFDPEQARFVVELVAATGANVVMVMPAALDAVEARDLARAFAALGATYLLPTRLDAARRLGAVLTAAATGLLLTEAGTSPNPADGLTRLTPAWLAERLRRRSHRPDAGPVPGPRAPARLLDGVPA